MTARLASKLRNDDVNTHALLKQAIETITAHDAAGSFVDRDNLQRDMQHINTLALCIIARALDGIYRNGLSVDGIER